MKVIINARSLLGRMNSGIGKYVTSLLYELQKVRGEHSFIPVADRIYPGVWNTYVPKKISSAVRFDKYSIRRIINHLRGDVYHTVKFVSPVDPPVPVVATIHDLYLFRNPDAFPFKVRKYWEREIPRTMETASVIISPSEFTRREIKDLFPEYEDKVVVVPHGVSPLYYHPKRDYSRILGKYIMSIGMVHPRKNLSLLIDAWRPIYRERGIKLVLVGEYGWKERKLKNILENEEGIEWFRYVDENTLRSMLGSAMAFAFPSLYEGFGLPVLEAMASSTPVVALDIPVMREVTGGNAILVANDPDEFREGLLKAIDDREKLVKKAVKWSMEFTWQRSAEGHIRAYEMAV